jgi:hypothetical protein
MKQMKRDRQLVWREVTWLRPFELADVQELLTHLATVSPCGYVTWEVRGCGQCVRYLVGADKRYIRAIEDVFHAHANVQFAKLTTSRKAAVLSKRLKTTKPMLSLKTDNALAVVRAALAVMVQAQNDEEIVLQIVLGSSIAPSPVRSKMDDPHASWLDILRGDVAPASNDSRTAIREKVNGHGFNAVMRIGVHCKNDGAGLNHLFGLMSALRTLESAGVRLSGVSEKPNRLDLAYVPWHFPLRLSIKELSCLFLLPIGSDELSGVKGIHPKLSLPPEWIHSPSDAQKRSFGVSTDQSQTLLNISPRDSLEHTILLGPTGSGKSTAMLNLVLADINAGRSVLVIDPKADLVNDVLCRIPDDRIDDVVVIDPSDACPVGFNPLAVSKRQNNGLVADAVLAVLKEIFADSWGIRTQDILSGALLTLAQTKDASLVMLPTLLTDANFRRKILMGIDDRIGLLPFWSGFEAMGKPERAQVIAPVLNKMRQFILRPELRNVLGQAEPKFNFEELFTKRKIVLVPLNKGIIGAENARLLGSLIVGLTWTLALSRASLPPERRYITSVFIDELQDYLSLPTDLSDALSQARGLGVGITMAHQYRAQLAPDVRAGIDANARNKIVFGLNAPDAKDMAIQAPKLDAQDFMYLPRYEVYTNLQVGGRATGWISGKSNPMPPVTQSAAGIRARSQERYGRNAEDVERDYLKILGYEDDSSGKKGVGNAIGRKKKTD